MYLLLIRDAVSGWAGWALAYPGIWEGGLIMPTTLMLDHPDLKTASLYIHLLKIRDGGTGVQGHPDFYRSVNPISTTGQIMSTNYYLPPQIFRPSTIPGYVV